ncbi:sec-independent protein translocase protein TATB, chloroplastic-like isoform X3 [Actinidia eriantha]|uniref:sec-independent protein translocase protein TATB, chloroplastic-like isoform X3 n=1 Tax=Actinidia eriantha TaxID=165200 RepID=UPI00258E98A3|nr:sec-independent protein translocase protein TATB, chloroplastic-like isoform X3 [Actinidia eriantha]
MTTHMASAISSPSYLCLSPSTSKYSPLYALSSTKSYPKTHILCLHKCIPQLGLGQFSRSNGLRHLGMSISQRSVKRERKRKIYASLFGVGAPEALVIGVVALLVFGPKGLAEVARNLGKTLRAFQPTIKELQDVSREFKSTLEREIGLDEIQSSTQSTYSSTKTSTTSSPSSITSPEASQTVADPTDGALSPNRAYSTEDYLKITEEQLKASAAQQQTQTSSTPGESQLEPQTQAQDVQEAAAAIPPNQQPKSEI